MVDVLLVSMPFGELIGQDSYGNLATDRQGSLFDLTGEWLFSDELFDRAPEAEHASVRDILIDGKAWVGAMMPEGKKKKRKRGVEAPGKRRKRAGKKR